MISSPDDRAPSFFSSSHHQLLHPGGLFTRPKATEAAEVLKAVGVSCPPFYYIDNLIAHFDMS